MASWLTSMGIPQDRSSIISTEFRKASQNSVNTLSLDDLELLVSELITKYNFK